MHRHERWRNTRTHNQHDNCQPMKMHTQTALACLRAHALKLNVTTISMATITSWVTNLRVTILDWAIDGCVQVHDGYDSDWAATSWTCWKLGFSGVCRVCNVGSEFKAIRVAMATMIHAMKQNVLVWPLRTMPTRRSITVRHIICVTHYGCTTTNQ